MWVKAVEVGSSVYQSVWMEARSLLSGGELQRSTSVSVLM